MTTYHKLAAVVALFVTGVSVRAQEGFIRPEAGYSYPTTKVSFTDTISKKLGGAFTYGVTSGATFGAKSEHEISVSLYLADYNVTASATGADALAATNNALSSVSAKIKVKSMPVLLNYRYLFGSKADSTRFYLAPSIGFNSVKTSFTSSGIAASGGTMVDFTNFSDTTTGFCWCIGAGVQVKMTDKIDLNFGYRYASSKAFADSSNLNTHDFFVGVGFKF